MKNTLKHPIVIASIVLALAIVGAGYWYMAKPSRSSASFSPAHAQALTERVPVSGTVTSAAAVDLAFERSGKIVSVAAQIGTSVSAGAALVSLDGSDLAAQLAGANATLASQEAQVASQEAKLAALQKGSRPEDIALAQTQVSNAQNALSDAQKSMMNTFEDAYTKSDQAIHNTVDAFFSNPTTNPQLSFTTTDSQTANDIKNGRLGIESMLVSWRASLDSSTATAVGSKADLDQVRTYLSKTAEALSGAIVGGTATQAQIDSWKASVAAARTTLNAAYSSITAAEDSARNADSALKTAQDQLAIKQAGATAEDIASQQAALDGARAGVQSAQAAVQSVGAQMGKLVLRAPLSGIITKQDAHIGAVASPNVPLVSMISGAAFQIEASVSEAEIAKIKPGEDVSVTLDAYGSSVSFPATVTSVDPSATMDQGVASYRVVIQFKQKDERIKTGMTANADIITAQKESVLAVPWNAVIQRAGGSFVVVKNTDGTTQERSVETGIRSGDMVEITSGLADGDLVASFGTNQ